MSSHWSRELASTGGPVWHRPGVSGGVSGGGGSGDSRTAKLRDSASLRVRHFELDRTCGRHCLTFDAGGQRRAELLLTSFIEMEPGVITVGFTCICVGGKTWAGICQLINVVAI